ncbi:MAG TPA: hypothetical protein VMT35_10040, partial [Ignavibacteriaceae bacterium]|nr:hypothetical protein [Ignavibacteriaceae bacterium]
MNCNFISTQISIKLFLRVLIFFLLISPAIFSQSLESMEKNYYQLESNLKKEKAVLDSLKLVLNEKGNEIDNEKNKKNPDKDKIVELMSASITISNKYDAQQKKVAQLQTKYESAKIELDKKYSLVIDSLKSLQNSGEFKGDMNKLNSDILYYTETKLAVGPKISLLSFDPSKLLKIDPNKSTDSLEKAIYKEYLQDALTEVDYHLKNINEQQSEINQMLALERKTEKFLKETEFQKGVRTQTSKRNQDNLGPSSDFNTGVFGGVDNPENAARMTEQFKGYTLLLNQLNLAVFEKMPVTNKLEWDAVSGRLSLREY